MKPNRPKRQAAMGKSATLMHKRSALVIPWAPGQMRKDDISAPYALAIGRRYVQDGDRRLDRHQPFLRRTMGAQELADEAAAMMIDQIGILQQDRILQPRVPHQLH